MEFKAKCCFKSNIQKYECTVIRGGVAFDGCLWQELTWLWEQGVKTLGCCCGRHIDSYKVPYIQVEIEDIKTMRKLGYKMFYNQLGVPLFAPKTVITDDPEKCVLTGKSL